MPKGDADMSRQGAAGPEGGGAGAGGAAAPLAGLSILATGMPKAEKLALKATVEALGGAFQLQPDESAPPDVLLATGVTSTYRAVLGAHPGVPAVTPAWLKDCRLWRTRLGPDKYRLGPFTGFTVSMTGFDLSERDALCGPLAAGGGTYVRELRRYEVSHLVAKCEEGEKVRYARAWGGIRLVSGAWLTESIAAGRCLPETDYPVPARGELNRCAPLAACLLSFCCRWRRPGPLGGGVERERAPPADVGRASEQANAAAAAGALRARFIRILI